MSTSGVGFCLKLHLLALLLDGPYLRATGGRKCALLAHGSGATASKTEAMYYPPTRLSYDDGDTAPFTVLGPNGEALAS